jgi:hypothetical protein
MTSVNKTCDAAVSWPDEEVGEVGRITDKARRSLRFKGHLVSESKDGL